MPIEFWRSICGYIRWKRWLISLWIIVVERYWIRRLNIPFLSTKQFGRKSMQLSTNGFSERRLLQ